jgi:hypothetical protein
MALLASLTWLARTSRRGLSSAIEGTPKKLVIPYQVPFLSKEVRPQIMAGVYAAPISGGRFKTNTRSPRCLGPRWSRSARKAKTDQHQAIEIPRFQARETGDNRRAKANRQQFPASAGGSEANKAGIWVHDMF